MPESMPAAKFIHLAREHLEKLGYLDAVEDHPAMDFSEQALIRELAWVILCSEFEAIRGLFGKISLCFMDWISCEEIGRQEEICVRTALDVFGSKRKIEAITSAAKRISTLGFENIRREVMNDPILGLRGFGHIGDITVYHLAKILERTSLSPTATSLNSQLCTATTMFTRFARRSRN